MRGGRRGKRVDFQRDSKRDTTETYANATERSLRVWKLQDDNRRRLHMRLCKGLPVGTPHLSIRRPPFGRTSPIRSVAALRIAGRAFI